MLIRLLNIIRTNGVDLAICKIKNAQLSGRQWSLFLQKEVTTQAAVVHPIPKWSGKRIKRRGQNKKQAIHLESRWSWINILVKLLFNCPGFILGSEIGPITQVLELHSFILGKSTQKKQLQCNKGSVTASPMSQEPTLLVCSCLPRSASFPILFGMPSVKGSSSTWVVLPSSRRAVGSFKIWLLVGRVMGEALHKLIYLELLAAASCKTACQELGDKNLEGSSGIQVFAALIECLLCPQNCTDFTKSICQHRISLGQGKATLSHA